VKNVAGSGGKWLDVSAERFPGWITSFAVRHGISGADGAQGAPGDSGGPGGEQGSAGRGATALTVTVGDDHVSFTAQDGSVADCFPPFPPVGGLAMHDTPADAAGFDAAGFDVSGIAEALAAHARRPRVVGVLLVRLGGYAAGVFTGYPPVLQDAKVGSRPVHGRSAAGGWSQHRFARRREKQANEALDAAAAAAVMIFGKQIAAGLDAVVFGGDRRAVAELRDDPRLAPYFRLATDRFLTVPDPKRAVLLETPKLFAAVKIRLTEA
jgi:Actinobacteria/chloroflexi VLRF1 release factor